jgi:hypothetical protein
VEGVMKLLINQLVIIETFCSQLKKLDSAGKIGESQIPEREFKKLTQKFKAVEEIGKIFVEGKFNRGIIFYSLLRCDLLKFDQFFFYSCL